MSQSVYASVFHSGQLHIYCAQNWDMTGDKVPDNKLIYAVTGKGYVEGEITASRYDKAKKTVHLEGNGLLNFQTPCTFEVEIVQTPEDHITYIPGTVAITVHNAPQMDTAKPLPASTLHIAWE